jgi:hypothetical protein
MLAAQRAHLETFGFVVLQGFLDPAALSVEFDASMRDGFTDPNHMNVGTAGNNFRYVPTMCEWTPVSLALVTRLGGIAAEILGSPVLPVRAKATSYRGSTKWHRDTDLAVRSLAFAFYLEPLSADEGALRVIPGSHRPELATAIEGNLADASDLPSIAVPTVPGDAIVFDEHLFHASVGGGLRRQWRVDFVADAPHANDTLTRYFARQYAPGWDGGYDVERFPSYGDHWRTLDPYWNKRLYELGAYAAAAAEESFVRARRHQRQTT